MEVIIFLGPPGSGKGTQADLVREKLSFDYIGSGDLLRERKKKDDFTGNKIAAVIDRGERVPTPVVFKIWMDKLESFKQKNLEGLIFDGSPRTMMEAEMLDKALDWYDWEDKKVVFIDVSEKESTDRLLHRRICEDCGEIYPYTEKYKKMEKCEECGGKLVTRKDDNEKAIEKRWDWYKEEVKPVIDYYEECGLLKRVDGEQTIEAVFEDVLKAIK